VLPATRTGWKPGLPALPVPIKVQPSIGDGWLAFSTYPRDGGRLFAQRVGDDAPSEIAQQSTVFALRNGKLAYFAGDGEEDARLHVRELPGASETTVAVTRDPASVWLTDNSVVWAEYLDAGITVSRHDLVTGETRVLESGLEGALVGAVDDAFVTEASTYEGRRYRVKVRVHEIDGEARTLAEFDDDGLAGQTQVLGNRVVFVNADRKVVVVSLDDEGRFNFEPF
jgi:hypothetical protein